jgi:cytidylate kinase
VGVITVSSSFGSGGSVVASKLADRLGWSLHNRAIPEEVASRLSIPLEAAVAHDEASDTRIGQLLARFSVHLASQAPGIIPPETFLDPASFKQNSESIIRRIADAGDTVIVGRAGAIVLQGFPGALHVRFDGGRDRRIAQAAAALGISTDEAAKRLATTDRARSLYVKQFYGRDWADPSLFHMVLDSTQLSVEKCVEIVLAAAEKDP